MLKSSISDYNSIIIYKIVALIFMATIFTECLEFQENIDKRLLIPLKIEHPFNQLI